MSQFQVFCASALKAKQLESAATIQHIFLGAQAGGKDVQKTIDSILKQANGGN